MKKMFLFTLLVTAISFTHAQEYKLAKSTGRLEIKEVNHVIIEGHSGNEIIFSTTNYKNDKDERAQGLRAVSGYGLEDNSGIGLSVVEKGGTIEVRQMKKMGGPDFVIKVPKGVIVSYQHTSPYGREIEIKNFEGEVEVSTVYSGVKLLNTPGPLTIKTVHGNIETKLPASMKSPISIVSVHGHVDVALPMGLKADIKLGTVYGELYIDPDFKIEMDSVDKDGLVRHDNNISGKINGGGGVNLNLSSTHNNVYLRKNK